MKKYVRKIINWIKSQRQWHKDHLASWKGKTEAGGNGLSSFQKECLKQLGTVLSKNNIALSELKIDGNDEKFITGLLPISGRRLWIYLDGAEIEDNKNKFKYFYEEWDYRTPDDMMGELIAAVIDLGNGDVSHTF